jgi:sterol 3beta-glucosyltransferase
VCITLGSSTGAGASRIGKLAIEALRLADLRGIIVGKHQGLSNPPDNIFVTEYVPYSWLFPRVLCAVHHGGAGTTGQALRAGVPSIVVPFTSDQPFWGRRVHALGAGPRPIPAKKLSMQTLAGALGKVVGNPEVESRARELSERIRAEDGVAAAIEIILRYAEGIA